MTRAQQIAQEHGGTETAVVEALKAAIRLIEERDMIDRAVGDIEDMIYSEVIDEGGGR